jgi:hypothetical protein
MAHANPCDSQLPMNPCCNPFKSHAGRLAATLMTLVAMPAIVAARSPLLGQLDLSMPGKMAGIEQGAGPQELALAEPFIRFSEDEQHVDFQLGCHPDMQTYFTVKVWGSSGSAGYRPGSSLLLHDPDKGDAPFDPIARQDGAPKPSHHPRKGEIVRQLEAKAFPGRFYYATYPIPREMTRGRSTVRLRLVYKGRAPGLEVYRVYTHLDPFFEVPESEVQGKPFELGPPRQGREASPNERHEHWKKQANAGFRKAREFQLFGERWEKAKGEVPSWAKGVLLGRGSGSLKPGGAYREDHEVLKDDIKRWGGHYIRQGDSQMLALRFIEVFAHAYQEEWSDFHRDPEMLERIAAAFDFYCRAQGNSGGFMGRPLPGKDVNWPTWLGGPVRSDFSPGLEVGQRFFWDGFSKVLPDLDKGGFLEVSMDDDLDPGTPEVSRREAYTRMARRSFDLYSKHVPQSSIANQMIHNFLALKMVHKALKHLDPANAGRYGERVNEMAEIAVGIRRNPVWNSYSYSPDGMPLEDGYDSNYGKGGLQLAEVAELTRFPKIERKTRLGLDSYAHFVYLSNDSEGYRTLRNVDWLSARVIKGVPGPETYFLSKFAAKELQIPAAIRYFELQEEHGRGHDKLENLDFRSVGGLWDRVMEAVAKANDALDDSGSALPPTDFRLPDERGEDSAFVDEYLGLVALRHGDARLFAALNWESRMGRDWAKGTANHIVRLKYTTPTIQRLVTANCVDSPDGALGLNTLRYGPYFIVLNASEEKAIRYAVPADLQGQPAIDLLTGERADLDAYGMVAPMSSRVFVVAKSGTVPR